MDSAQTCIACLTPAGRAAIAVLAVRGPRAWEISRTLFQPTPPRQARSSREPSASAPQLPENPPEGRFWVGRLGDELRDEVVLAVKRGGVEVQCHGGPEVVRLLMETYVRHGAIPRPWSELEVAAPLLPWLVQAPTVRTAAILLDQHQGAFERKLGAIRADLDRGDSTTALAALDRLLSLVPLAAQLVQPWRVVVAGAPNTGKSSLVNALAGYTRCLVSPIPGTTRDLVATTLAIDGWPIELIDTAGQRFTTEDLEEAGIARARRAGAEADLRLWLVDAAAAPVWPPDDGLAWQLIINKIDLPPAWDLAAAGQALQVSALTRAGLEELCQTLSRRLVPVPPEPGEAVPVTPEACLLVQQIHDRLRLRPA